jgi:hypothetical protein
MSAGSFLGAQLRRLAVAAIIATGALSAVGCGSAYEGSGDAAVGAAASSSVEPDRESAFPPICIVNVAGEEYCDEKAVAYCMALEDEGQLADPGLRRECQATAAEVGAKRGLESLDE